MILVLIDNFVLIDQLVGTKTFINAVFLLLIGGLLDVKMYVKKTGFR